MKKVEISKSVYECEVCKKHFSDKAEAKDCEVDHKRKKIFDSVFKEAESLEHFETIVKRLVSNVTVKISNLRPYAYRKDNEFLFDTTLTFSSTDNFKKSKWFFDLFFCYGNGTPFISFSGGGGDKILTYEGCINLKKFPKIYPKYVKFLELCKEDQKACLESSKRSKKIDDLVRKSLETNEEHKKLFLEEEIMTKEYNQKLEDLRNKRVEIHNSFVDKFKNKIPEIKINLCEDIEKQKEQVFGNINCSF